MSGLTMSSINRLIALTIMSAAALLIFIMTGTVFYNHHHRQLISNSITKDLQSTPTIDLSTSVGLMMTSASSNNIPYAERQALPDLHEAIHGSKRNYISSSAGAQWSFDQPPMNPFAKNSIDVSANQAVSHEKGMWNTSAE
jgi:cell division protein FtsL